MIGGRVLITEDQPSYGVLGAVRALAAAGYAPWLAVGSPFSFSARSRAAAGVVRVPDAAADPAAFVTEIARIARDLAAAAVLPGTEPALAALAAGRDRLPAHIASVTCDPERVGRATDKRLLVELAAGQGLDSPVTEPLTRESLEDTARRVGYPAVVKPVRTRTRDADGRLQRGSAQRVASAAELGGAVDRLPGDTWLLQPYVEGELYAIAGVAWEGDVVCACHQVALRIHPAGCGMSSYATTVPADVELERRVRGLIGELGWSGVFQLQFLRTSDRMLLIDLNPRIYGSISLAIAAGMNLPAIWADLLTGRSPVVTGYDVGVRFRSERDLPALVHLARAGRWRSALAGLAPRRRTAHAIFAASDPLPLLAVMARALRPVER